MLCPYGCDRTREDSGMRSPKADQISLIGNEVIVKSKRLKMSDKPSGSELTENPTDRLAKIGLCLTPLLPLIVLCLLTLHP